MLSMTRFLSIIAAAFLTTAVATPVFAQAAIQEPGAYAFYHPNANVLDGRFAHRGFEANALYNEGGIAPQIRQRAATALRRARSQ
jgi:hypothetical protein